MRSEPQWTLNQKAREVAGRIFQVQTRDDIVDSGAIFAPPKDAAKTTAAPTYHLDALFERVIRNTRCGRLWHARPICAKTTFKKREGSRAGLPRIGFVYIWAVQISLNKYVALHAEASRHALNFVFAERRPQFPTAVGTRDAVDSGPHTVCDIKDTLVDLARLHVALL